MKKDIGYMLASALLSLSAMANVDVSIGGNQARCLSTSDATAAQNLYAEMPHIKGKVPLFFGKLAAINPNGDMAADVWSLVPADVQSLYQRLGLAEQVRTGQFRSKADLHLYFAIYATSNGSDKFEFSTVAKDKLKNPGQAQFACFGRGFSLQDNCDDTGVPNQLRTRSFPSDFLLLRTSSEPAVQHGDVATLCLFIPSNLIKDGKNPALIQVIFFFKKDVTLATPLAGFGNFFPDAATRTLVEKCIAKVSGIGPSTSSSPASSSPSGPSPVSPMSPSAISTAPTPPGPPPPSSLSLDPTKELRERLLGAGAASANFREKQAYAEEVLKVTTEIAGKAVGDASKVNLNEDFYNWLKEYRKKSPSASSAVRPGASAASRPAPAAPAGGMAFSAQDIADAGSLGYSRMKIQQFLNAKAWAENQRPKEATPRWSEWQLMDAWMKGSGEQLEAKGWAAVKKDATDRGYSADEAGMQSYGQAAKLAKGQGKPIPAHAEWQSNPDNPANPANKSGPASGAGSAPLPFGAALRRPPTAGSGPSASPAPKAKSDAELIAELGYPSVISFSKAKTWAEKNKQAIPSYADWQNNPDNTGRSIAPSGSAAATPPSSGPSAPVFPALRGSRSSAGASTPANPERASAPSGSGPTVPPSGSPTTHRPPPPSAVPAAASGTATVVTLSFGEVENALRKAFEQAKTASGAAMALQLGSALKVLLSMLDDLKAEVGKLQKAENEILARRGIPQSGNIKTVLNGLEQADNLKAEVNALEAKVKESKFASKQEQVAGISRKLDEIFGVSGSS